MEKIDKLIEEANQTLIDKAQEFFRDIYNRMFKHFKYLDEKEFSCLMNIVRWWYYYNYSFQNDFTKNNRCEAKVIKKIRKYSKARLPSKLYRGLSFKDEKEYQKFMKDSKKNGFGTIRHSTGEFMRYSSWTSNKKMAEKFLPGGYFSALDNKIGVLLEVPLKDYKDKLLFSMNLFLTTPQEKKEFLKLIIKKETENNLDIIDNTKSFKRLKVNDLFSDQHGAGYSVTEDEYILDAIPFDSDIIIHKINIKVKTEK